MTEDEMLDGITDSMDMSLSKPWELEPREKYILYVNTVMDSKFWQLGSVNQYIAPSAFLLKGDLSNKHP